MILTDLRFVLAMLILSVFVQKQTVALSGAFAQGEGKAAAASGAFYYGDINPANFTALKEITAGGYFIPTNGSGASHEKALFGGFGYARFGIFGSSISALSNASQSLDFNGGALGAGYQITQRLSLGAYSRIIGQQKGGSAGLLYALPFEKKIVSRLGLYNPGFSLSASFSENSASILRPGASFSFFQSPYFSAWANNLVEIEGEFVNISFKHALRLNLFKVWFVSAGIQGSDFFRASNGFFGTALQFDIGIINLAIHSGIAATNMSGLNNSAKNDITAGIYLQTRIEQIERIRSTDAGVVTIFEPPRVITPNGDGKNDSLTIHLSHRELTHVKDWNLVISDAKMKTVSVLQPDAIERTSEKVPFPNKLVFSGVKADGSRLPDGEYTFRLAAILPDGESRKWDIGSVIIDADLPSFNVFTETRNVVLSNKPLVMAFKDNLADIKHYTAVITDMNGKEIYATTIQANAEKTFFTWQGDNLKNETVIPGNYQVLVKGTDLAGNVAVKNPEEIMVLDKNQACWVDVQEPIFSPNNDKKKDETVISVSTPFKDQITSWKVEIISQSRHATVKVFSGTKILPDKLVWDGKNLKQKIVPDGDYSVLAVIKLNDGTIIRSLSYRITVDNTAPILLLTADNAEFTPDADGVDDAMMLQITASDESKIVAYRLKILNNRKKLVKEISEKNLLPPILSWDGMQSNGYIADSYEKFFAQIEAMDNAGNIGKSNIFAFKTGLIVNRIASQTTLGISRTKLNFPNIIYPPGSDAPAPESETILQKLTDYLAQNPLIYVEVVGHTDRVGGLSFNEKLSKKRAEYVKKYFTDRGMSPDKVLARGAGYSEPLYPETDKISRERNRRIELFLHPVKPK